MLKKQKLGSQIIRNAVYKKCKGKCSYCGIKMTKTGGNIGTDFTVDHINPTTLKKIDNDLSNLAGVCLSCNTKKKHKNLDEYIEYLKKKDQLTLKIISFYGGYKTRQKYGDKHFSELAKKKWAKEKKAKKEAKLKK